MSGPAPRLREPLRRRLRARLIRGLTAASRVVPEPLLGGALSCASGLMGFSRYERLVLDNLELALGDDTTPDERRRIAAGVRRHCARLLAEWIQLSKGDVGDARAWLERRVRFDPSVAILDRLAAEGRGLLIASAHIGNWEVLAAALRVRGLGGYVVGLQRRRDSSSQWLVDMRRAYGVESLPQDVSPRVLLETLRAGRTIGLVCDLEVRRLAGEFVPFFGRPALTMTAPAALARAARLPVVPVRCIARGAGYELGVGEPLHLDPALDRRAAATELLTRLNGVFEGWIRETPEQWAWHQPRWRTRPGELEHTGRPLAAR